MADQTDLLNVSDEMKLEDDRQNLCEELCSSLVTDARGDGLFAV